MMKRKGGMEKSIKLNIIKTICAVITVFIIGGGLFLSWKTANDAQDMAKQALKAAEDSNDIANNALKKSEKQFIQINRPHILLSPKRFDNGLYWKIIQQKNVVKIILKYEIENVGNVSAKDVDLPHNLMVASETPFKEDFHISYKKPTKTTLGPTQKFYIEPIIEKGYDSEGKAKNYLEQLISEKSQGITFSLSVNYINPLKATEKYLTLIKNIVYKDRVKIIYAINE